MSTGDMSPGEATSAHRESPAANRRAPDPQVLPGPRVKVLHLLVTMPVGGAEDLVSAIVTGLNPDRFQVQAACIGDAGPVGRELSRAGHPVISLGLDIKHTATWRVAAAVRRLLKEVRPDILHTHLYHPNLYGRLAALGLGLPGVVAAVHNSYTQVKWHRRVWNFLLSRVTDRVLVGSAQVWRDVRHYDGVPAAKLLLMPYGIPLAELETPLSAAAARERLGVAGFIIGTVGRLEEQKGHEYLLAALPALSREINDLVVLVVGAGRREEALRRQATDLGVAARVRFLGTRRDLPLIYRSLDLFVLPSLWEGLPLALLKAMAAGLPVAATRVSGVLEAIADGVNGRLADPGDPQDLARVILSLYRQPEERSRLGAAARQTVRQHYSQEAMLARLENLYLELWRQGGKGVHDGP